MTNISPLQNYHCRAVGSPICEINHLSMISEHWSVMLEAATLELLHSLLKYGPVY
jgi:hypothetical protein